MPTSPEAAERERARRIRGRDLETVLAGAVTELGFKREKGLYLAPLASGTRKWLALQIKRDADTFSVYPNVGVRHDELHLAVDRLYGRGSQPTPTLVRMLGYLMPQNTANVAWEFQGEGDPSWAARATNIAQHIEQYAFPWMDRYRTLDEILTGIDAGLSLQGADLRPVALLLLGRRGDALRQLEADVQALGDRTDPAAANFRHFAEAVCAEVAATDTG